MNVVNKLVRIVCFVFAICFIWLSVWSHASFEQKEDYTLKNQTSHKSSITPQSRDRPWNSVCVVNQFTEPTFLPTLKAVYCPHVVFHNIHRNEIWEDLIFNHSIRNTRFLKEVAETYVRRITLSFDYSYLIFCKQDHCARWMCHSRVVIIWHILKTTDDTSFSS